MAAPAESSFPRLPNFKVIKLLGKGSYGKVYKVERENDNRLYALKETDLSQLTQMERMDAVNEIRLLVSIHHPSVIRYHEAFLCGSKLCVVEEYAPYGDLRYYITKGQRLSAPFPEEAIWRIFLQLARGLQALHANNIIHRDIKPANIFLCQNDVLKIGDLGVAKALTKMDFARTQIGTPVYMAPEVWTGKLYSYSSDLWSLGCVLYEMMMFKVPIEGRNMNELKLKVTTGHYNPIPAGRYSAELTNFCHSLLTVDPQKRPTPQAILTSSAASKWLRVLPAPPPEVRWSDNGSGMAGRRTGKPMNLLDTILVPKDFRQLVLPPPSYDRQQSDRTFEIPAVKAQDLAAADKVEQSRVPSPRMPSGPPMQHMASRDPTREPGLAPSSKVFRVPPVQPGARVSLGGGPINPNGNYAATSPSSEGMLGVHAGSRNQPSTSIQVPKQRFEDQMPGLRPGPRRISCS